MSARGDQRGDFWSRRRAAVEAEQQAERAARLAALQAEEEAKLSERTDAELLAELDLPEPEAMETTEQVQTLLKSAVPQRLKTRALRRLWRLNPVLANVDGLVDYGQDFTDAAMVIENMQTAYQVGKGMLKAIEWQSPKAPDPAEVAAAQPDPEADTASTEDATARPDENPATADAAPTDETPAPPPQPGTPAATDHPAPAIAAHHPDTPEAPPATARRMRFRFDTAT